MRTQARLTAGHRSAKADVQYLHELWDCRTVHVDSIAEVLVFAEQRCKFIGGEIQHRVPIGHRALDDAKVLGKGVTFELQETEAKEILAQASHFCAEVEDWITKNHPLLKK